MNLCNFSIRYDYVNIKEFNVSETIQGTVVVRFVANSALLCIKPQIVDRFK